MGGLIDGTLRVHTFLGFLQYFAASESEQSLTQQEVQPEVLDHDVHEAGK